MGFQGPANFFLLKRASQSLIQLNESGDCGLVLEPLIMVFILVLPTWSGRIQGLSKRECEMAVDLCRPEWKFRRLELLSISFAYRSTSPSASLLLYDSSSTVYFNLQFSATHLWPDFTKLVLRGILNIFSYECHIILCSITFKISYNSSQSTKYLRRHKFFKPSSCTIQITKKTRFSLMDVILALATIVSTQPSHSLVFKVRSNK